MSLAVKNLDYEIGNERILDQISLEIKEGEFVGLVGPNGCGKSTLLKHIYRTYKPKGQTVFLDGKDIMDLSAKKLAGELAVMAQENQLEFDYRSGYGYVRTLRPQEISGGRYGKGPGAL